MNYTSPIEAIETQIRMAYENGILKAVHDVGFIVEKEELEKALAYDRDQYNKGFADAKESVLDHVLKIIDDEMEQLTSKALRIRPLLYQGSPDLNGELWACLDIKERVMALKGGDKE